MTAFWKNIFACSELWDYAWFSLKIAAILVLDWFATELLVLMTGHFGPD